MGLAALVAAFFVSKRVALITAFVCWPPEQVRELSQAASSAQLRVRWLAMTSEPLQQLQPYGVHREGVLLDLACPGADRVLREASESRALNLRHSWLLLRTSTDDVRRLQLADDVTHLPEELESALPANNVTRLSEVLQVAQPTDDVTILREEPNVTLGADDVTRLRDALQAVQPLPDADVTAAVGERRALFDVYRVKEGEPLVLHPWDVSQSATGGNSCDDVRAMAAALRARWAHARSTVARRKDLGNVYLNSEVIVSQPQHFRGWDDVRDRQIDTYPKLTHPIMMRLAEDLHFRYNLRQVDSYGVETNGSFDGLAGRLQRGAIEVGVASMFMRADRWRVLHFCAETLELRGAFLFRQPSQSATTNVFVLPFSRGVWLASLAAASLSALVLAALARALRDHDPALAIITPAEAFTFTVGTVCQQGSFVTPALVSARLVMVALLLCSLSVFAAYSAKVVAILQAPSDAIRTIDDLTQSRMDLGVQETTYKKVYFAESTDPATQRLFRRKLLPLGEAAYLSAIDGIERVRTGSFAFQVEEVSGYDVISRTYTESEKCGLKQIQAFSLPMVAVPIRKHSGYKDLLAARLRWQREVGLMAQTRRIWMAARPRCDAGGGGFLSVGLTDVLPALQMLGMGAALAVLNLLGEIAAAYFKQRRRARQAAMYQKPMLKSAKIYNI